MFYARSPLQSRLSLVEVVENAYTNGQKYAHKYRALRFLALKMSHSGTDPVGARAPAETKRGARGGSALADFMPDFRWLVAGLEP
jgi:hypothetical protein